MQDGHRGRLAPEPAERGVVQEHPGGRPGAVRAADNHRGARFANGVHEVRRRAEPVVDEHGSVAELAPVLGEREPGKQVAHLQAGRLTAAHRDDRVFGSDAEGSAAAVRLRGDLDAAAREQADAPYGGPERDGALAVRFENLLQGDAKAFEVGAYEVKRRVRGALPNQHFRGRVGSHFPEEGAGLRSLEPADVAGSGSVAGDPVVADAARGERLALFDHEDAVLEQLVEATVLRGADDHAVAAGPPPQKTTA